MAKKVIRVPVKYRYDAIHPEFLKMLAEIAAYANEKYGSWTAYIDGERMTGDADPINHIYEHLREYRLHKHYDHFEGDVRRHLAAIAYNAMMAFVADSKWGTSRERWVDIPAPLVPKPEYLRELAHPKRARKKRK
jgi:hypothetical protein